MPAFFRNANELGILDPVGAYRSNMDARRGKLVMQRLGVAEQERLGGGVYVQPRNGLEPRGGANLQYLTAWVQIGERRIGHIHGGAAVQVDHGVVVFGGNIHRRAHAPHACRIDQNADVRQFILQGVAQVLHIARAGQVKRQHPDGHRADGLQRFQPVTAAGDGPKFFHFALLRNLAHKLAPQTAGSTGHQCNFHGSYPQSQGRLGLSWSPSALKRTKPSGWLVK